MFIEFSAGRSSSDMRLRTFRGRMTRESRTVMTSGPDMFVQFITDNDANYRGWQACVCCGVYP